MTRTLGKRTGSCSEIRLCRCNESRVHVYKEREIDDI